jgi:glycosyltransferase involved in cell wall biosynthesis
MNRRILHCIPSLICGGAERQLAYLAPELIRLGWEVHVAFARPGDNLQRLGKSEAVLHPLPWTGSYDPRLPWEIGRIIRRVRPDLIQTWLLQMDVVGGLAARFCRVPWVLSERTSSVFYRPSVKNWLRAFLGSQAAGIACNSSGGAEYWSRRTGVRQWVIPNAIPWEEIDAAAPARREDLGLEPADRLLVCVGRFDPSKNLDLLVSALAEIPAGRRVHALLLGDGPLRSRLEQMIEVRGLAGRVRMPGYLDTVWPWLKTADLFVLLSSFEGHPNAVMEAMACGCPVLVSDIPAHREMLDDQSAALVDFRSPRSVAQSIQQALASPETLRRRARTALDRAHRWSIAGMARQYHEMYLDLLCRAGKRAA